MVDTINEQTCTSATQRKCSTVRHPVCHVMKVGTTDNTCLLLACHVSIVNVSLARVGPGLNMLGQSGPDTLTL